MYELYVWWPVWSVCGEEFSYPSIYIENVRKYALSSGTSAGQDEVFRIHRALEKMHAICILKSK